MNTSFESHRVNSKLSYAQITPNKTIAPLPLLPKDFKEKGLPHFHQLSYMKDWLL
jgi:hypothetical protein